MSLGVFSKEDTFKLMQWNKTNHYSDCQFSIANYQLKSGIIK